MKLQLNRHPAGWGWNLAFAAAQLVDGVVRTLSLGMVFTDLPLSVSRRAARACLRRR